MSELPITRSEGVPLAVSEVGGVTWWPRELYPSADDALAAAFELDGHWWPDVEQHHVRLVWLHRCTNHPEGDWWYPVDVAGLLPELDEEWPDRELEGPPVECWEVAP